MLCKYAIDLQPYVNAGLSCSSKLLSNGGLVWRFFITLMNFMYSVAFKIIVLHEASSGCNQSRWRFIERLQITGHSEF